MPDRGAILKPGAAVEERSASTPSEGGSLDITIEQLADPQYVVGQMAELIQQLKDGIADPETKTTNLDIQRLATAMREAHKIAKDAHQAEVDPLRKLADNKVIELNERELKRCREAVRHAEKLSPAKKKRWKRLIDETLKLQQLAKKDALCFWAYVGRTQEEDKYMEMAPIHRAFMDAFCSDWTGVVQQAHPQSGKSHTLYGYVAWRIGNNPNIRILWICQKDDNAEKALNFIRQVIQTGPYRALFPHVRIAARAEGYQNKASRFAVERTVLAKDYTLEAAAWNSGIQGDRYDEVIADDMCPPEVETAHKLRLRINRIWENVVEPRVVPEHARFRCICTPWHDEDHAGMVKKQIRQGRRAGWAHYRYPIEDDAQGNPISIWPERYPPEFYAEKRARNPHDYARLFGLETRPKGERIVTKVWYYPSDPQDPGFHQMAEKDRKRCLHRLEQIDEAEQWLCVDPAATRASYSSRCWVTQIALTASGHAYVRKAWDNPVFLAHPGDEADKDEPLSITFRKWLVSRITGPALFRERYVDPKDPREVKERKRQQAAHAAEAEGGIDHVLIEETGGQKLGTDQWIAFIKDTLRDMGVHWRGSVRTYQAKRGGETGILISKTERLELSTWCFDGAYIRFPGRIVWDEQNRWDAEPGDDENIGELTHGVLHFPVGKADGVDTLTEFILHNRNRLRRDLPTPIGTDDGGPPTRATMVAKQIEAMWDGPKKKDPRREEDEWLRMAS